MTPNYEKYVSDANAFFNEVAEELFYQEEKAKVVRITRCVLHTLRDRIPVQESIQMIAQLPMFMKAFYVDGWSGKSSKKPIQDMHGFVMAVVEADGAAGFADFPNFDAAEYAVLAVTKVLKKHVSEGEVEDLLSVLPKDLRPLLD